MLPDVRDLKIDFCDVSIEDIGVRGSGLPESHRFAEGGIEKKQFFKLNEINNRVH